MSTYKYKPLKLSIYDDNFKASNSNQNFDEKLTPLDTHSFNSDDVDDDVPLLKLDNPQQSQQHSHIIQQYHQHDNMSNDSDSVLLNLDNNDNQNNQNNNIKNNKQLNFDMYSRNIIRFFILTIIIVSVILSIIIIGGIDYHNTDSDKILYGTHGNTLFKYYYIINICSYIIFLLFSLYLILYIICCSGLCTPVREITFFKMLKLNLGFFALNIMTKIIYCTCLMFLIDNDLDTTITKIPKYYNYIIIESISYLIIQLMNIIFVDRINNLMDFNI